MPETHSQGGRNASAHGTERVGTMCEAGWRMMRCRFALCQSGLRTV
ncbi:MAG: hypothetical protein K2K03_10825 [Prevotella sp.]|nr:hypothetical protein [Prevotella sp.]